MIDIDYDRRKVDELVLALLYLTVYEDGSDWKASKVLDRSALERLYQKGVIRDPTARPRQVTLTDEGVDLAEEFFKKHFGSDG